MIRSYTFFYIFIYTEIKINNENKTNTKTKKTSLSLAKHCKPAKPVNPLTLQVEVHQGYHSRAWEPRQRSSPQLNKPTGQSSNSLALCRLMICLQFITKAVD